ncbi:MAG: plasmid pRiA4b ORF-3 family protein [Bacteroidales bacterium]|nr:plasmid pRiA4b ORF-3 family protein [Bacteroidales bacterium]
MTFQFKIQLQNITKPPVWRRVLVPSEITFDQFHNIIQDAFGWENEHLYAFSPSGYGSSPVIEVDPENDAIDFSSFFSRNSNRKMNAKKTKISDIFNTEGQTFTYIYDFGDNWVHKITLEKIDETDNSPSATLLNGKGACPPEDCGGPWGYEGLKEAIADKSNPEREEMLEWLGLESDEEWNPQEYNFAEEAAYFNRMYKNILKKK